MGNDMSRRHWFRIVAGFLAAFGLVPQTKAKPAAFRLRLPSKWRAFSHDKARFRPGTTTYVYNPAGQLTRVYDPRPDDTEAAGEERNSSR
jgi:hypothetical protein